MLYFDPLCVTNSIYSNIWLIINFLIFPDGLKIWYLTSICISLITGETDPLFMFTSFSDFLFCELLIHRSPVCRFICKLYINFIQRIITDYYKYTLYNKYSKKILDTSPLFPLLLISSLSLLWVADLLTCLVL